MNTQPQVEIQPAQLAPSQLRGLIRYKLLSGAFEEDVAHEAFGGISAGGRCHACDLSILRGKTEILTFGTDGSRQHYHPECHLMLSVELEDLAQR